MKGPGGAVLAVLACVAVVAACGADRPSSTPPASALRVTVATGTLVPQVATGVAVADGRVLTVAHVLAGARRVTVGGRGARVLRVDRGLDLALVAVPGMRARRARLADGSGGPVAVAVVRRGRTRSLPGRVRRRVVVRWREQPGDPPRRRPALELAATVEPGDSGAPVLDASGRVRGVVYARAREHAGTAWAVDASAVRAFLTRATRVPAGA